MRDHWIERDREHGRGVDGGDEDGGAGKLWCGMDQWEETTINMTAVEIWGK